ncbi:MAG: succinyl-diaminopimelate desuccinylase [Rickettsiales bacterium]|nr:succinyl-diaminopimelate desuccinylase [Rickettsiales bacterium]
MMDAIKLSQQLIQIPSYSGNSPEVIGFIKTYLEKLNFTCDILEYEGSESYKVNNLHALYNPKNSKRILYFAGHTDVVATGDIKAWTHDPFAAKIVDGKLFGRGTADMKCAVACFMASVAQFLNSENPNFGIGFLITNDEENDSINGTAKVLEWMQNNGKAISACIVGEPTNPEKLGEMLKIGRRGSIGFTLKIIGKQGHVAYPDNALNPITTLVNILKVLKEHKFDDGNEFFSSTNLETTSISSDNFGNNVIPAQASASFNIRFNSLHDSKSIVDLIEYVCQKSVGLGAKYELTKRISGESFLSKVGNFAKITQNAVEKICGTKPVLSTTGGTSDARFIKDHCDEIVECGLVNKTAHQIDEFAYLEEITKLQQIYFEILKNYDNI